MAKGYPDYRYLALPLAENDGGTGVDLWAGARVYNSAAESIPDSAETALTFDSERYDHGDLHSTTVNTSRLTAVKAGKYLIAAHLVWAVGVAGDFYLYLRVNGATYILQVMEVSTGSANLTLHGSTLYELAVGDYVEVVLYQASGTAQSVQVLAKRSPDFAMQWVGP